MGKLFDAQFAQALAERPGGRARAGDAQRRLRKQLGQELQQVDLRSAEDAVHVINE